jgi:DNA-binding HxlR family transcriptional regulator
VRAHDTSELSYYSFCTAYAIKSSAMIGANEKGYGQFCPVAMAADIFCARWTPLILREMLCGSTRFNDIRRGLPRISPTLLSRRLKELEKAGLVEERKSPKKRGTTDYRLTTAGEDLREVVISLGLWGHRWIESSVSLKNLDPSLLMWDMRRHLVASRVPNERCTVKFVFPELSGRKTWWVVIDKNQVDICLIDPGYEVDLHVRSSLRSMTSVWMGITSLKLEIDAGNIELSGEKAIERSMHEWLGLSPFAKEQRHVS